LFHYVDEPAVDHLLRVAAGLDSLVLGEAQILGQVAQALEQAQEARSTGHVLSQLFQAAVHAGKRARTETEISRHSASVPSQAVSLAARHIPNLAGAQVVIVGAGEMAKLTIEALRKRGVVQVGIVNRSPSRLSEFSERWGAEATTFEHLEEALDRADILIASTGAKETILPGALLARVIHSRPHRPLVVIDIGMPRNVDLQAGQIPGIHLYDLDSLSQQVESSLAARSQEVPKVEAILKEEESRFLEYFKALEILPLISDLNRQAESIRQTELQKTLRRLPELSEVEIERIDALTRALVKKLLNPAIAQLRLEAQHPSALDFASLVRDLYDLKQ
jgi:glutamyl-tRNA reductase